MRISILCIGKIKEKFYRDAIDEYLKRLSAYANVKILQEADEKTKENASEAEIALVKEKEGIRMAKHWDESAYHIALCIEGKKMDSVEFSKKIDQVLLNGCSHIQFLIGGSLGLSDDLVKKAELKLSFSDMTFPHQLMRVILLEQIYRAQRISHKEPYHK